ncbi:nucleotide sugar dehydrogenase [Actinotalea sp. K2]|uniref:nucleotide sugar dehydrogenase n=1 Tax=Actinotalea sp. K2 TaxID=2939438 RepID=UPI002016F0F8|nr:nucleotide sugar dehydrogenase [Actinotalea sp. K2]MCL3861293.1 nucleotide sugar dehydrogenase [Actinotalea sp. K2]
MSFKLAVIGTGYVGLPLIREAIRAGIPTFGFDIDLDRLGEMRAGRSRVDDISDDELATMLTNGFTPTAEPSDLDECDTYVICVPTPLTEDGGPDLSAVISSAEMIAKRVRPGDLVVLESTTYPGTTEEVVGPILETSGHVVGRDILLAFSPERIDPGNPRFSLRNTPKVVGGVDERSTARATELYSRVCDEVVIASGTREAELAKLLENTYRHVNIALMNELAQLAHELDIDLWESIRCASTKPFGFHAFYPGPGVGGHCIPIDPNYLSHHIRSRLRHPFRFVELAQEINAGMPAYVARRTQDLLNDLGRPVRGSRILLLGVTYKENIADQRESPARDVATALLHLGADLHYWDPYVAQWQSGGSPIPRVMDVAEAAVDMDCAILLQNHRELTPDRLAAFGQKLLDTRGVTVTGRRL